MVGTETYGEPCPKCSKQNTNLESLSHTGESILYCFDCGYGAFYKFEELKNDWFIPTMNCLKCGVGVQWWVVKRVGQGNPKTVKRGDIHYKCYECDEEFTDQENIPQEVRNESLKWLDD
tara:strand:- start:19612 stop:19968 length:357 start_codon:yes stop_codon:yes gene_type:complete